MSKKQKEKIEFECFLCLLSLFLWIDPKEKEKELKNIKEINESSYELILRISVCFSESKRKKKRFDQ